MTAERPNIRLQPTAAGAMTRRRAEVARCPCCQQLKTMRSNLEKPMTRKIVCVIICFLGGAASMYAAKAGDNPKKGDAPLRLGNFSVSLNVKDIAASRAFYEKLGFTAGHGGDQAKKWLVLQNETATIGLFQGMFEKNSLTFNPGWDRSKKTLLDFDDVRDIQRTLKSRGLVLTTSADEASTGPAYLTLLDPDGNPILLDQHVPAPRK